jgi:Family of unknown function (DUF7010)
MQIADAQRDMRYTFAGGLAGQGVSAALWFVSAALGTWGTPKQAILSLVAGGFFIFPLTWLVLRLSGRPARLHPDNRLNQLAMQVAFTLPLTLPIVGAATLYELNWFYPSFMIVLGAHYLPFAFLYGMPLFAGLCTTLVSTGVALGMWGPAVFPLGGWITGVVLVIAGLAGGILVSRERATSAANHTSAMTRR